MKAFVIYMIFGCSFFTRAISQTAPEWINSYNSSGSDNVILGYAVDSAGNSYSLFYVSDTTYASPVIGPYLVKYNSSGQIAWNVHIAGNYSEFKLCLASGRNLYVGATKWNNPYVDFQLIKFDTSGQILWHDSIGTPQGLEGGHVNGITLDDSENIYLIGTTNDLDRTAWTKCDSAGNIKFLEFYDNYPGSYDRGNAISIDGYGNAYLCIASMDSVNFYNSVLLKCNNNGQVIWEKRIIDTLEGFPQFLKVFRDTLIYMSGIVTPPGTWSDYQTFQFDSSGNIRWMKLFDAENYYNLGNNVFDNPHYMLVTSTGNVAITGDCVNNGMPWWVNIMYDQNGNLKWVSRDFSTVGYGRSIAEDYYGNLIFAGEELDPNLGNLIGLSRYDTLGNRSWLNFYSCPTSNYYYSPFVGCDYAGNIFCNAGNLSIYDSNSVVTLKYANTVDIHENYNEENLTFSVFPNPASHVVSILAPGFSGKNCSLKIFNMFGQAVFERKEENAPAFFEKQIDVSELADGIYFICLAGEDGKAYPQKIIVKH